MSLPRVETDGTFTFLHLGDLSGANERNWPPVEEAADVPCGRGAVDPDAPARHPIMRVDLRKAPARKRAPGRARLAQNDGYHVEAPLPEVSAVKAARPSTTVIQIDLPLGMNATFARGNPRLENISPTTPSVTPLEELLDARAGKSTSPCAARHRARRRRRQEEPEGCGRRANPRHAAAMAGKVADEDSDRRSTVLASVSPSPRARRSSRDR